ncbi:MAG: hypothetical protein CMO80_16590 [Verrucomicrobiales bacterium]|nr:hypothetical protein [Verrucomicrobiales bacterium]
MGIGNMALATMLARQNLLATPTSKPVVAQSFDARARTTLGEPKAKAMISLFMHGGPSHMDLTDPKPELSKRHGQQYPGEIQYSFANRASKKLKGCQWEFQKHGQCGTEISELLPHTAGIVDDICLVRSMYTGGNGHEISIRFWHGGIRGVVGRPTMGAWLTYGLGSEADNLPAYMVLKDPGGNPTDGASNWSNGWLPPLFRGTVLRAKEPRIHNLTPPDYLRGELQRQNLDFLRSLNERHLAANPGERDLEARIESYELAARMQVAATEALDISGESEATKKLYGINDKVTEEYGKRCLIARRLVERGVRFVQLFLAGQPWDNHKQIAKYLPQVCARTDKPCAALVRDLKARGLLDSTIVHWGGEIGRLPVTENNGGNGSNDGRDHNGQGFSCWVAGGGFKGGMTYGETDEFGHRAVKDIVTPNDYQATVLHQFGLDHKQLTFQYNGQEKTLTNEHTCRVVKELLA